MNCIIRNIPLWMNFLNGWAFLNVFDNIMTFGINVFAFNSFLGFLKRKTIKSNNKKKCLSCFIFLCTYTFFSISILFFQLRLGNMLNFYCSITIDLLFLAQILCLGMLIGFMLINKNVYVFSSNSDYNSVHLHGHYGSS